MQTDSRSNLRDTARPHNPTHFGGEGLYATPDSPEDSTGSSRSERPAATTLQFVKRNPLPLLAIGGLIWLLAKLVRESTRG